MSRLKDLVSKGVRLIVADPEAGAEASPTPVAAPEREIPAEAFQPEPESALIDHVNHSSIVND